MSFFTIDKYVILKNVHSFVPTPSNNTASNTTADIDYSSITTFPSANYYHPYHFIQSTDYTENQLGVEQGWLGDDKVPLADLDTENPDVVNMMNTWIANLTEAYGVDGLRIDTVKHVRKDFWPAFAKASGVYTIGEVSVKHAAGDINLDID